MTASGRLRPGQRAVCSECLWQRPAGRWAGPSTSRRQMGPTPWMTTLMVLAPLSGLKEMLRRSGISRALPIMIPSATRATMLLRRARRISDAMTLPGISRRRSNSLRSTPQAYLTQSKQASGAGRPVTTARKDRRRPGANRLRGCTALELVVLGSLAACGALGCGADDGLPAPASHPIKAVQQPRRLGHSGMYCSHRLCSTESLIAALRLSWFLLTRLMLKAPPSVASGIGVLPL